MNKTDPSSVTGGVKVFFLQFTSFAFDFIIDGQNLFVLIYSNIHNCS